VKKLLRQLDLSTGPLGVSELVSKPMNQLILRSLVKEDRNIRTSGLHGLGPENLKMLLLQLLVVILDPGAQILVPISDALVIATNITRNVCDPLRKKSQQNDENGLQHA
jgi:hypothetical protein